MTQAQTQKLEIALNKAFGITMNDIDEEYAEKMIDSGDTVDDVLNYLECKYDLWRL